MTCGSPSSAAMSSRSSGVISRKPIRRVGGGAGMPASIALPTTGRVGSTPSPVDQEGCSHPATAAYCRRLLVVEEPPCGQGESGPEQSGGLGEVDAQGLAELFESAGRAAVVEGEQLSGPAYGAGGAVGVQGLQVFRVAGHAGDRGHVGVVPRGVLGDL